MKIFYNHICWIHLVKIGKWSCLKRKLIAILFYPDYFFSWSYWIVFCGEKYLHRRSIGSGSSTINRTANVTNIVHENCDSNINTLPKASFLHYEHITKAHNKTGKQRLITKCVNIRANGIRLYRKYNNSYSRKGIQGRVSWRFFFPFAYGKYLVEWTCSI